MPIWKITDGGPVPVAETGLQQESLLEKHLEDWIMANHDLLGERLMIIGHQVMIPDVRDRIDVLALDAQGNAVIVELKRGALKDPVDMQALRYASYISRWRFEDFESQARSHRGQVGDPDFNFNELYRQFCEEAGVDEAPDLNVDQRIIIVGAEVRARLGSVALWLLEHNVDIKVIEVEMYREGKTLFLQPHTIIPSPIIPGSNAGRGTGIAGAQPWVKDGKNWHLDKQCGPQTREMLLKLDDLIRDNLDVDGPRWNQRSYVAYRVQNYNWLSIHTSTTMLRLEVYVKAGTFEQADLARSLAVQEFRAEESMSEKLGLLSSVQVLRRDQTTDDMLLRIKKDFDLEGEAFLDFLKGAYDAFPR